MIMTAEEIVRDYLQARNKQKQKQIKILADLNQTTQAEIKRILAENCVEGVEAPKRPRNRPFVQMKNRPLAKLS